MQPCVSALLAASFGRVAAPHRETAATSHTWPLKPTPERTDAMSNRVVARYQDGRIVKGTSLDVDPNRPNFHVIPSGGGRAVDINLADLKALFFVRSLEGDPSFNEDLSPNPEDPRGRGSTIVALRFADGEEIVGLTIRYPPNRPYFFVVPVDTGSNNIRILVNRAAVVSMEQRSQ